MACDCIKRLNETEKDIDEIVAHIDAAIDIASKFTTVGYSNSQFEESEVYDSGWYCCICDILHNVRNMIINH